MKKGIFFLLFTCMLFACSKEKSDSQEIVLEFKSSEEFNSVLSDIASLNDKFGCDEMPTKSGARDFFYQVADYAGGYYGARLGGAVGFAAGTAAGSPALGAFVAGGCGMLGGIAGSVVASKLFNIVCDYAGIGYSVPIELLPDYYEGSSGSAHNQILHALESNGKDYVDINGDILVEEMFRDALDYEELLHTDGFVVDSEYIKEMEAFCRELYTVIGTSRNQGMKNSQICNQIYGLLREKGCNENEIMELEALGNVLLPCVSLDIEEVSEYELEFNGIIESSELNEREKYCLGAAGSVYIHSVNYWY